MALIKVGIHENLCLSSKSKVNEHGTLELAIKAVQSENALMEAFENNTTFESMESSFRFYPPSLKDFDQNLKSAADIGAEMLKMRHQFKQYALLFTTEDVVNDAIGGTQMFSGLGIAPEKYAQALTMLNKEEFLKKVCTNLATKFLNLLTKLDAFSGKVTFRQKFLRQSKDKNFAVIPNSTFETWVEPMTVPKESSKVVFSQWEVDNKKNDPNPGKADSKQSTQKDAKKAANLFGGDDAPATDKDTPKPDLFKN